MRIAIITLPLHYNYGGILQAFALERILHSLGHDAYVVRPKLRYSKIPFWVRSRRILKQCVRKFILQKKVTSIDPEKFRRELKNTICLKTDVFTNAYIKTIQVNKFNDLKRTDFDAYVVGSDQIWRSIYFKQVYDGPLANAYLKFTDGWNVKRIAYAPSFGTDLWEYTEEETQECGEALKQFGAISVREDSGIKLCKKKFGLSAECVLDPTMLLTKEDYIDLFLKANIPQSNGNLHYYILDSSKEKLGIVDFIAKQYNFTPFRVNLNPYDPDLKPEERVQPSVEQWLRAFYDARYVVTDSFHACVFSILFQKQFVVIGNKFRGMSRFYSLLEQFGLVDRLIEHKEDIFKLAKINYDVVYEKLEAKRHSSMKFLANALSSK